MCSHIGVLEACPGDFELATHNLATSPHPPVLCATSPLVLSSTWILAFLLHDASRWQPVGLIQHFLRNQLVGVPTIGVEVLDLPLQSPLYNKHLHSRSCLLENGGLGFNFLCVVIALQCQGKNGPAICIKFRLLRTDSRCFSTSQPVNHSFLASVALSLKYYIL